MNEQTEVAVNAPAGETTQSNQNTKRSVTLPPVDIFEDANGITLLADLPGVSKDRLNISIDADELLIEGEASVEVPADIRLVHGELRAPLFRRAFTLSQELDRDKISANLKHGVLRLHIPRLQKAQPRQIPVNVA
ncbi:Hsp20/alpha crystallin family protein [Achromobacter sp. Marseille-Q4962]|uniref:Hsp20/alpha crystallin family protein n=1 Tax=Achromobacter sp. Marseille-Q4962 TaxID=2942202 RepID=UPI0020742BCD|nr:Hsp20/alpha crystallin family protein [Achromobacter sp. Marseille-Q4962]